MKIGVEHGEHVTFVDRRTVPFLKFVKFSKCSGGNRERKNARGHDLDFLAHRINIHDILWRKIAHDRATIRYPMYNSFFFELE